MRIYTALFGALVLSMFNATGQAASVSSVTTLAQAAKVYEGRGTLVGIIPDRRGIVIDHGPIDGLMDAMTMKFNVEDPKIFGDFSVGDRVRFKLRGSDMTVLALSADKSAMKPGHGGAKMKAGGHAKRGHMSMSGGHEGHTAGGVDHNRPDARGPVGVMGDHVHHPGSWTLSYNYARMDMEGNRDGTSDISAEEIATTVASRFSDLSGQPSTLRIVPLNMSMDMHMLGAMYTPLDWLSVMAMGMYMTKSMDHVTFRGGSGTTRRGEFTTESDGFGDSSVSATARIHQSGRHTILLNAGVSIPTGSVTERDDILTPTGATPTVRLPYAMQLGSGTFDFLPGITYTGGSGDFGWGGQYRAVVRMGRNDEGYSLGDAHRGTVWGSYRFAPWVSGSIRFAAQSLDSIDGIDSNIVGPVQTADPDNYGGTRADLGLGLNFVGTEGMLLGQRIGLEATVPVYQDLNGPQLETDWTVWARLAVNF